MRSQFVRISRAMLLAVAAVALSGCVHGRYRASRTFENAVSHMAESPVTVISRNGAVHVIADRTVSEVSISARIACGGVSQEEADQRVQEARLEVTRSTSRRLTIKSIFPSPGRNGDGAHITVRLPDVDGVEVDTSNGRVVLNGLAGPVKVDTSNGSIEIVDHNGPVQADTSNGSVSVSGQVGRLDVETSNASVTALDIAGPVDIDTSNGSIRMSLSPDQAGPIRLDTSNASIHATVGPAFVGSVRLDTSNSRITIEDPTGRIRSQTIRNNTHGNLVVGAEGPQSFLDTSNASITFIIE